jgi:hypothetical protein
VLVAELGARDPAARLPYQGWLDKTLARAEALFGKVADAD